MVETAIAADFAREIAIEAGKSIIKNAIKQFYPKLKSNFGEISIETTIIINFKYQVEISRWRQEIKGVLIEFGWTKKYMGEELISIDGHQYRVLDVSEFILPLMYDEDDESYEIEPLVKKGYIILAPQSLEKGTIVALRKLILKIIEVFQSYGEIKIYIRIYDREFEKYEEKIQKLNKLLGKMKEEKIENVEIETIRTHNYREPFLKIRIPISKLDWFKNIEKVLLPLRKRII